MLINWKCSCRLNKLSNVIDNDIFKKTVYDKIVIKVHAIDTSWFVLKFQYKAGLGKKINDTDKNIPDICGLLKYRF